MCISMCDGARSSTSTVFAPKTCKADYNGVLTRMGGGVLVAVLKRPTLKDHLPAFLWLEISPAIPSRLWFNAMPHTQMATCNPLVSMHVFDWVQEKRGSIFFRSSYYGSMQYALQDTDGWAGKSAVIHLLSLRSISQRFLHIGCSFILVFLLRLVSLAD